MLRTRLAIVTLLGAALVIVASASAAVPTLKGTDGPGFTITHDGMRFDVLEVEGSRILKLAVTFEQRREQRDRDDVEREALEAELFDAEN